MAAGLAQEKRIYFSWNLVVRYFVVYSLAVQQCLCCNWTAVGQKKLPIATYLSFLSRIIVVPDTYPSKSCHIKSHFVSRNLILILSLYIPYLSSSICFAIQRRWVKKISHTYCNISFLSSIIVVPNSYQSQSCHIIQRKINLLSYK